MTLHRLAESDALESHFFAVVVSLACLTVACSSSDEPAPSSKRSCPTESGTGCAPQSQRVDLYSPTFSKPTQVTNQYYPVSNLHSVVFTGTVDSKPFRTETTILPKTHPFEWNGQTLDTVVQQYMAFSDGRLEEVAIDWFAQDDRGAVWYFGEDVSDYNRFGVVFTHEGTWAAGDSGYLPAINMPPKPELGQAWWSENAAPAAFEEIVIVEVGATRDGPRGPVTDVVVGSELHMDNTREEKLFATGYGEFSTGSLATNNLEALALAIPTDKLDTPVPASLVELTTGSADIFDAAGRADWTGAESAQTAFASAWTNFKAGQLPPRLRDEADRIFALLGAAIAAKDAIQTRQLAIDVARVMFDLRLRHEEPIKIDRVRFDLWLAQMLVDAPAGGTGEVRGDVSTLELVWDRISHTFDTAQTSEITGKVQALRTAADANDLAQVETTAAALRTTLASMGWRGK